MEVDGEEEVTYIIEEVEVDDGEDVGDVEEVVFLDDLEPQRTPIDKKSKKPPSKTLLNAVAGPSGINNNDNATSAGAEREGNLIKKLINGELSFSEYNKKMDKHVGSDLDDDDETDIIDAESVGDDDENHAGIS